MIAFVFPGQGSQKSGMGASFVGHPSWELVEEASDICRIDVASLLTDTSTDELRRTDRAQLAVFVTSMVVLDAVERCGLSPAVVAGHSLGEYTALCAAGVVSFEDALALVKERGEGMRLASEENPGTMAAVIGTDLARAQSIIDSLEDVWIANDNAPGQFVIAGRPEAVEQAAERLKSEGAKKIVPLDVGGAFHTPLMAPALGRLAGALDQVDFRPSDVPVVANVDAQIHSTPEEWRVLLERQLTSRVCWRESVQTLVGLGARTFVEIGPGGVLTGLVKRVDRTCETVSVDTPESIDALLAKISASPEPTVAPDHAITRVDPCVRVVITPTDGTVDEVLVAGGEAVEPGQAIAVVGGSVVASSFGGTVGGVLVSEGQRLSAYDPVAWLRARDTERGST